ncbi:MAG: MarR family transcriptional regulator [Actinobacteria bacterium]|nr:MarR family transcriptional regulator [Actinomycetota bacterium]
MSQQTPSPDVTALQTQITAFVRAFGLHQPDQTPCGRPIPVSEAHALMEIERDGPLPQHELATRLRLEKSTVSRLVSQLHGRGWIERGKRDGDARVIWLKLTDAGRTAATQLATARTATFAALLDAIPADKRDTVLDSITTLVEALRDHR